MLAKHDRISARLSYRPQNALLFRFLIHFLVLTFSSLAGPKPGKRNSRPARPFQQAREENQAARTLTLNDDPPSTSSHKASIKSRSDTTPYTVEILRPTCLPINARQVSWQVYVSCRLVATHVAARAQQCLGIRNRRRREREWRRAGSVSVSGLYASHGSYVAEGRRRHRCWDACMAQAP